MIYKPQQSIISFRIGLVISVFIILLSIGYIYYNTYYLGEYRIEKMWFGSEYKGDIYCDNCLWIEVYEGCNRYRRFYFEEQHKFDERLEEGMPINILWDEGYIKHIFPAKRYNSKC